MLSGRDPGRLAGDPAIARCAEHPVPVVSAAMSPGAVRRAAACGVGLIFESLTSPERIAELMEIYPRSAGGDGPAVLVRRAWVGPPPRDDVERQRSLYRTFSEQSHQAHWGGDELISGPDAETVADGLAQALQLSGCGSLNLRLHAPGIGPGPIAEQIVALGEVATHLRRHAAAH